MQYHYSVPKQEPHQRPHRSVAHILIILIKSSLSSSASASNQYKPPALSCALSVHSHTYCLSLSACIPAAQQPNDLHTQLQMETIMRKGLSVAQTYMSEPTRGLSKPHTLVCTARDSAAYNAAASDKVEWADKQVLHWQSLTVHTHPSAHCATLDWLPVLHVYGHHLGSGVVICTVHTTLPTPTSAHSPGAKQTHHNKTPRQNCVSEQGVRET